MHTVIQKDAGEAIMKENRWLDAWGWMRTLLASYGVTVLLILGMAFLMYRFKGSGSVWSVSVYAVYLVSCGLGGFLTGRRMGSKRLLWGVVFSLLYVVVLALLSWAIGDGWQGAAGVLGTVLATCLAGGAVGAILS